MWAIGLSLLISGVIFGDDQLTVATLAIPPMFVVLVKAMGLYDRDEHLLHKTTLDEVPTLFGIATLSALLLWLSGGLLIDGHLGRPQVLGTWLILFVLMVVLRSLARMLANGVAPPERCLLIGDPKVAEKLRQKLALTHSARAELVGVVPTEGPRVHLNGTENGHDTRTDIDPNLGRILTTQEVDRVIITTGPEVGRDDLLYIIRELKAYGVKVSVLPEASRVAGSSLEIDHLHGLTLLGVRRFEADQAQLRPRGVRPPAHASLALPARHRDRDQARHAGTDPVPPAPSREARRGVPADQVPQHGRGCRRAQA